MNQAIPSTSTNAPGLFRRLGAMLYDTLLVTGLLLMAIVPVVVLLGSIEGWDQIDTGSLRRNPFYIAYLLSVPLLFFVGFWKLTGQTLGMRTWRIRLMGDQGNAVSWRAAIVRYFAAMLSWAPLGLGFLWILIDPEKLAWHDRLSHTRLILVAKEE
ncbi:MAG: RDD family protein [Gammaproteobacteria bacterium]|nr:RDD family protein [Gammaproteobacteria bacterium]MCP5418692.1 RDD family protein [Chromatiaceae bacterium]